MNLCECLRLQHVCLVALADESLSLALIGKRLHSLLIQVERRHLRARLRKGFRHRPAQHAARACDDDHFSAKVYI